MFSLEKYTPCSIATFHAIVSGQSDSHLFTLASVDRFRACVSDHCTHTVYNSGTEQLIVNHSGSLLVIGRAGRSGPRPLDPRFCSNFAVTGSGKTTCMIYRLLATQMSPPEGLNRRLRSVFCTASEVLASKVQENFSKLASNFEITKLSKAEVKALAAAGVGYELVKADRATLLLLPSRWGQLTDDDFPLFVSFNDVRSFLRGVCISS